MKNMFFKIGEPIANVTQLSSVVANNVDTSKLTSVQRPKTAVDDKFVQELSQELQFKNKDVIDKITNLMVEQNASSLKMSKELQKEDVQAFAKSFLDKLLKERKITQEQYNRAVNTPISEKSFKKFKSELRHYYKDVKDNIDKAAKTKEFQEKHRREIVNSEKGYRLNIVDGEINSKKASLESENLRETVKKMMEARDELKNNLKYWIQYKKRLVAASIGIGVTSIVTGFFSFFFPFLAIVSVATATSSLILNQWTKEIEENIRIAQEKLDSYKELISDSNDTESGIVNIHALFWGVTSIGKSWIDVDNLTQKDNIKYINYGFKQLGLKKGLVNFIKTASKSFTLFAIANDAVQLGFSVKDFINLNNQLDKINKKEEEINRKIMSITEEIKEFKKYGWTVISETEQTDYYWNGGRGGKNLVFRNQQTGEEKTIQEMLKTPEWQLRFWGLQKVHDKIKGDYIRKLRNDTKEDNLG
ncbi:hypothetical protein NPA08_03775 [Mycoplasmopsis citelli]|uniref:hypothetical protein n=1 Tax=Mycoplasmopsis citelli TaxID=171281 RepID=UPI00211507A6|nr:hypothetical protein [Mycoplasmopsis citelli]UUD36046.1 hypothetical protein NPA08_03775 [Mycoplasmopsis citelli]